MRSGRRPPGFREPPGDGGDGGGGAKYLSTSLWTRTRGTKRQDTRSVQVQLDRPLLDGRKSKKTHGPLLSLITQDGMAHELLDLGPSNAGTDSIASLPSGFIFDRKQNRKHSAPGLVSLGPDSRRLIVPELPFARSSSFRASSGDAARSFGRKKVHWRDQEWACCKVRDLPMITDANG